MNFELLETPIKYINIDTKRKELEIIHKTYLNPNNLKQNYTTNQFTL